MSFLILPRAEADLGPAVPPNRHLRDLSPTIASIPSVWVVSHGLDGLLYDQEVVDGAAVGGRQAQEPIIHGVGPPLEAVVARVTSPPHLVVVCHDHIHKKCSNYIQKQLYRDIQFAADIATCPYQKPYVNDNASLANCIVKFPGAMHCDRGILERRMQPGHASFTWQTDDCCSQR